MVSMELAGSGSKHLRRAVFSVGGDVESGAYMLSVLIERLDMAAEPVGGGFFVTVAGSLSP